MKVPHKILGWCAPQAKAPLEEREFPFPELASDEVALEVLHCGVCHSDLHLIDNDWQISRYPLVPGHEILGRVAAAGSAVRNLRPGELAGVGWQRSSCGSCDDCVRGDENFCESQSATCVGQPGGFADWHVTKSAFCFPVPPELARPEAAPLFCGGITVYSPLCEFLPKKSARVGVLGLGGLGHFAVKFARAMGHEVTVFSHSASKEKEALALGASAFLCGDAGRAAGEARRSLDLLIVCANVDLPYSKYLAALRPNGHLCFVGVPPSPVSVEVVALLGRRLRISASPIGSPHRIREMLEFSRFHGITAQSEISPMASVNQVLGKLRENKLRYRAVLTRA